LWPDHREFVFIENGPALTAPQSHYAYPLDTGTAERYQIKVEVADSAQMSPPSKVEINGLRLRLGTVPDGYGTAVFARLSAANASTVWDGATIEDTMGELFSLKEDSATLTSDRYPHGVRLPASVFSAKGALIGADELDGHLLPGQPLYVTVTVEIPY
jgi:hypothetical protein